MVRNHTREAIDTLVLFMRNGKPGRAAMVSNSPVDPGWGKSTQQIGGDRTEARIII
jgi:hypothetical protein